MVDRRRGPRLAVVALMVLGGLALALVSRETRPRPVLRLEVEGGVGRVRLASGEVRELPCELEVPVGRVEPHAPLRLDEAFQPGRPFRGTYTRGEVLVQDGVYAVPGGELAYVLRALQAGEATELRRLVLRAEDGAGRALRCAGFGVAGEAGAERRVLVFAPAPEVPLRLALEAPPWARFHAEGPGAGSLEGPGGVLLESLQREPGREAELAPGPPLLAGTHGAGPRLEWSLHAHATRPDHFVLRGREALGRRRLAFWTVLRFKSAAGRPLDPLASRVEARDGAQVLVLQFGE